MLCSLSTSPSHPVLPNRAQEREGAARPHGLRRERGEGTGLPTSSARRGFLQASLAPLIPTVSAENAWVPLPEHSRGKYERERPASASGRKRQRERATPPRTQRWGREEPEGGGGRRRRREEWGRTPAPVARQAVVCSLPATREALIRRPEPRAGPSRRGAHVTRGPSPSPRPRPPPHAPAPEAAGARGQKSREDRAGDRPQAGSGFATAWGGSCGPGSTHPTPDRLLAPGWMRGGGSSGEPRFRLADRR